MRQRSVLRAIGTAAVAAAVGITPAVLALSPAAATEVPVHTTDFENGANGWIGRGATAAVTDTDGRESASSLLVTGRSEGWNGAQLPVGEIVTEGTYAISAWVKLAPGEDATQLNLGMQQPGAANEYPWVGGRLDVTADAWVQLSGEYTVDPATPPTNLYVEGASATASFLVDDVQILGPAGDEVYADAWDFETGTLEGWTARNSQGTPTVAATAAAARTGAYGASVSDRGGQGDGLLYDFSGVFEEGVEYDITAWVKLAEGEAADDIVLSIQTGESTFGNLETLTGVTDAAWVELSTQYTFTGGDMANVYFETPYVSATDPGTTTAFYVDDISVSAVAPSEIEDLAPIFEEFVGQFPVGVAIDSRETVGSPAELTLKHFNQVTAENYMKVEAWYDAERNFRINDEAVALMDFAAANDLRVYGHVLVWHSQTPDWFFQDEAGELLTSSDEDKAIMRERLRTHIFDVAEALSAWGQYGADNPMVAWDVVNEVVNDQPNEDTNGLRNSYWYQILGEEFIDLSFQYANEAFNTGEFAADEAEGFDRVELFINDYNTEQSGKQNRYAALVDRLLEREVPIDGVGHQFHVSLSMPVDALEGAIQRFQDTGLIQAVTELDVTVGNNPTEALRVEQGYYYRDAFRVFREYADELYSVTIWGLTDNRSWRTEQAPLVFNSRLEAKPAYYGIMDLELPGRIRTANVFMGGVPIGPAAVEDVTWAQLPLHQVGELAEFQLRWVPEGLQAWIAVDDATVDATDAVEFTWGEDTYTVERDAASDETQEVVSDAAGWAAVVNLPVEEAYDLGDTVQFNVEVTDGTATASWGDQGSLGTLTLIEPLSYVEVAEAPTAPTIDGDIENLWKLSSTVVTGKNTQGTGGAWASVKTLWSDNGETLYVLMDVRDEEIDATASNPWEQDSVEIYIDRGNVKNGSYRYDDNQIRIGADGEVSFGTGDEAFQDANVEQAVTVTDDGYVVEVAINLLETYGGVGTFHGVDFQVNDAAEGVRTSIRNWADPTGLGYQSTARWGVAQLVEELTLPFNDVKPGHPFFDEIGWMWESGLSRGYDDGTFRSLASVNRDAMAAFLYRVANGPQDAPACEVAPFSDVPTNHPFCGEITWFKDQGITTGFPDETFRPATPVSREAMAAFIFRMANPETDMPECEAAPFGDVSTGHPFCGAIAWMKDTGLSTGWSDGTFRPGTAIERQAMAAFLYRAIVEKDVFAPEPTEPEEPGELPEDFVPGGAVDATAAQVSTARGEGNRVALTFDDGPNPGETEDLLDFLAAEDIDAVFCVIGQNIQADGGAAILNRIVDEGHTLCNHSTSYADMREWTPEQVQDDLVENLEIIRTALGDPDAPVPYFRAPNGGWGETPTVAVALGMQPLGLGNLINDWEDAVQSNLPQLEINLRGAMTPGAVVLVHDGGGDRTNSVTAVETVVSEKIADGWTFTLPMGGIPDLPEEPTAPAVGAAMPR